MGLLVVAVLSLTFAILYKEAGRLAALHLQLEMLKLEGRVKPSAPTVGDVRSSVNKESPRTQSVGDVPSAVASEFQADGDNVTEGSATEAPSSEDVAAVEAVKPKRKRAPRKKKIDPSLAAREANDLVHAQMEADLAAVAAAETAT
jgi:hypothetical protein